MDIGKECPPQLASIPCVAKAVAWGDARRSGNMIQQLKIAERRDSHRQDKELQSFVDDRLPDFMRDLRRLREILGDGRITTQFMDFGK
jgi:hypothetical protein